MALSCTTCLRIWEYRDLLRMEWARNLSCALHPRAKQRILVVFSAPVWVDHDPGDEDRA